MNVCIHQQRKKKNKLGGSPLFPGIYSGPCRFLYLGEIERRSEATQKVKKKKKKKPCLPPQQSLPSDVCLRKSPSRFLPSFGVLFFLSFLLPILSLFLPLKLRSRFHTIIYSLSLTCLPSPSCLRLSPIKSIERKKKWKREIDGGGTCYIKRSEDYRAGNKARLTGSLFSLSLSLPSTQHPLPLLHNAPTCAYFIPPLIPLLLADIPHNGTRKRRK
jgi:hypothetical protein